MMNRAAATLSLFLASVAASLNVDRDATWPSDVPEGTDLVTLRCNIKSDSKFKVTWTKDDKPTNGTRFTVETHEDSSSLLIRNIMMEDTGTYKCFIRNRRGETASASDYLIVTASQCSEVPARITNAIIEPHDGVSYGENVNLTCVISTGENVFGLKYRWSRDGNLLNDTAKHEWEPRMVGDETYLGLTIFNITAEDIGDYTCHAQNQCGSDNRTLNLALKDKQKQEMNLKLLIIGVSVGSGVAAIFIFGAIVICARKRKKEDDVENLPWENSENYEAPNHPIEYDVFISYSSIDRAWVKDILMKNLENEGYRVCIDFKCFMPGEEVVHNIMEAIYKSKRTIVVMSKNFLKSVWGQFELQHVQHRLITMKDDSLLLVRYDSCRIPMKLMGKTFLDWSDKSVKPHFWERLFRTLGPERVPHNEETPSVLGLDIDKLSGFEEALRETERLRVEEEIRCLTDEGLQVEYTDIVPKDDEPLLACSPVPNSYGSHLACGSVV